MTVVLPTPQTPCRQLSVLSLPLTTSEDAEGALVGPHHLPWAAWGVAACWSITCAPFRPPPLLSLFLSLVLSLFSIQFTPGSVHR